jgi:hypothetical protein
LVLVASSEPALLPPSDIGHIAFTSITSCTSLAEVF